MTLSSICIVCLWEPPACRIIVLLYSLIVVLIIYHEMGGICRRSIKLNSIHELFHNMNLGIS
jgi:hypothetical protein